MIGVGCAPVQVVTYDSERGPRAGVIRDGAVVDAWDAIGGGGASVRELLTAGRLNEVADADGPARPLGEVRLLPPVPDPQKIIGIGLNYKDHAAEARIDPPDSPTFFAKFANALRADGEVVPLPESSSKIDYEAEVAFVVGRRAHDVSEADAIDHLAGYTLFNDLSARDLQFATPQWMPGKVFDGSGPCGPAIVTADEAGPHDEIGIALDLNGERMQESSTAGLIFSIPALVAHLSKLMTLEPGDIVSTGTPSGIGGAREPRVWLKPGDEVVVSSPQLGRLSARIG
jgi:2-keto-4-pentenoate hydratase/2-oxohepta-3-ene-1,7-dioic acid hydratase in catechol pathway